MSRILLLNKPYDVLCQFTDTEGRTTLSEYITEKGFYPAGRLDRDSEGLVLLTDDGKLQHCIAHPSHKMEKTYWVQVEGEVNEAAIEALRRGIELKDGPTRPARAERIDEPAIWQRNPPIRYRAEIPTSWMILTISEGRNRQVRRMTAAVGFPTLRLIRCAIGPWRLDKLASGAYREIPHDEVLTLQQQCQRLKVNQRKPRTRGYTHPTQNSTKTKNKSRKKSAR